MCSFFIHIAIWRAGKPISHMASLATIFVFVPLFIFTALVIGGHVFHSPSSWFVRNPFNISYVFIWHLALSAIYIMSYPAIQAESPSLVIILAIEDSMPRGLNTRQIEDIFPPDALIKDRFDDLLAERFIQQAEAGYTLTTKGRILSAIFTTYRQLLALPIGEG